MKRTILGVLVSLLALAGTLSAQELAGGIEGTVVDPQGFVIAGAEVTATNVETGISYTATAAANGRFFIPKVRVGTYTVTAESPGFRRAVVTDVVVEVGGTASVRFTLQVGAIEEEVTVTAEIAQAVINTVDAELSAVVDRRRVVELPLDGRNASHLLLMQAGVYFERTPTGEGDKLIVHGQRHRALTITLDGVDTQDTYNRASSIMLDQPLIQLTAENVQEFRVVTGLGTAEAGRGGAHMTAVTKAGTNEVHGSVFWFHRNTILNAHDFFQNAAGIPKNPLIRNQFGGSVGGPIVRDKTFFYFGIEGIKQSMGIPVNRTVYTAEARQGIFRYLDDMRTTPANVAANPGLIRQVNLLECGANVQAVLGRECVDNRFGAGSLTGITASVDPVVAQIMNPALVPLPNNFTRGDGLNTGGFRFNAKSKTDQWTPSFRLDHRFSDKHTFYGSFNYLKRIIDGDFINEREPIFPAMPGTTRFTLSRMASGTLSSVFRPTLINEFRAGFTHGENSFLPSVYPEGLNFPYTVDFFNVTDPLLEPGWGANGRRMNNIHFRDVLTWVKGKHQVKVGLEWRHKDVDIYSYGEVQPDLDFDFEQNEPDWTESDLRAMSTGGPVTDIETVDRDRGEQMMNELTGSWGELELRFNAGTVDGPYVPGHPRNNRFYNRELDLFFNDTWQLRPNLTLNLGLRWEYATVPTERDRYALVPEGGVAGVFGVSGPEGFFNPGVLAGKPCTVPTIASPTAADVLALTNSCATVNVPGGREAGLPFWNDDFDNFAPVVSLAWDPWSDGKTAIRAGFRMSYFQDAFAIMRGNLDDNEGLMINVDCHVNPAGPTCVTNPLLWRQGFPTLAAPTFDLSVPRTHIESVDADVRVYDPDVGTPYYNEWTLSVSRELFRNWALEVRYVGNRGVKLRRFLDFNQPNIYAFDPNTGMSFFDAFLTAQANYFCNQAVEGRNDFSDRGNASDPLCQALPNAAYLGANPLMDVLLAAADSATRGGYRDSSLRSRLEYNEVGSFIWRLNHSEYGLGLPGGSFMAAVLRGDLPLNFFQVNPFIGRSRIMVNDSFSTYHALEVEVRRRFAAGFTFQANYNWGKALSDFDGDVNELLNTDRVNIFDNRYEYAEFMPRHQFNANWIYELPFGPGKRFAPENAFWRKLVEGWQFGGIVRWRSGRPIDILSGRGSFVARGAGDSNSVDLSTPVSLAELRAMTGERTLATGADSSAVYWFDPCLSAQLGGTCTDPKAIAGLFVLPIPGRAGTLRRTPIFGPRRFMTDINFSKRTSLTETVNLEFRWEVFNLFNNTNFANPVINDILSANFGRIDRTITNPRLMQFALKVNF